MYLLQSLQGHLSVALTFIFSLKIFSDVAFLILQETNSLFFEHEKIYVLSLSTLSGFSAFAEVIHFSDYDFCTKWKMSFMISAPKSFLTQYIYIAMICRFLWWILTDLLFFQQIIKREIRFIFIDKSWRFFVNFINFVVHSHTMGHPKKRAVTKLRCRLVRTQMFLKTEHFVPPDRIFLSGSAWGHKRFGTPPSIKGDTPGPLT